MLENAKIELLHERVQVLEEQLEAERAHNERLRSALEDIAKALQPLRDALAPGESLHLEGCALPGGHVGDCSPASESTPLQRAYGGKVRTVNTDLYACPRCGMLEVCDDEDCPNAVVFVDSEGEQA